MYKSQKSRSNAHCRIDNVYYYICIRVNMYVLINTFFIKLDAHKRSGKLIIIYNIYKWKTMKFFSINT